MTQQERMTERVVYVEGGPHIYKVSIIKDCDISGSLNNILQRLGQYEDTGLSPEEITTMYITGGYWKKKYEDVYVCSNCNKSNNSPTTFCPHCGCQMTAPMQYEGTPEILKVETVSRDYVDYKINKLNPNKRVAVDAQGNIVDYAIYESDKVIEVSADYLVHQSHCCVIHGCKYGDKDCPVVGKKIKQLYLCYDCNEEFENNADAWKTIHEAYQERNED